MKVSLYSPAEVEATLERLASDISASPTIEGDNSQANGCSSRDGSDHGNDYELEIDFDPPARHIRINSPEDLLSVLPTERPTRSYNVEAVQLAQLLEQSHMLFGGQRMTCLTLNKVFLLPLLIEGGGPEHDLDAMDVFWKSFQNLACQKLRHVMAKDCMIHPDRWLERGLSHLPQLKTLQFDNVVALETMLPRDEEERRMVDERGLTLRLPISLTMPAVATLLRQRINTLMELDIGGVRVPLDMDIAESACQALIQCKTLRRLSCPCFHPNSDLTKDHNELFGRMIAQAPRSLRELSLGVLGLVPLDPIADGLEQNTGLQYLTIHAAHKMFLVSHHPCSELLAFRDALAKNVTLRGLAMLQSGEGIMPRTRMSDELLRDNLYENHSFATTRYLWSGLRGRDADQEVDDDVNRLAIRQLQFYLRLNKLGRGHYLPSRMHLPPQGDAGFEYHCPSRDELLNIVFTNRDDVSVSFYFFQLNPSFYFV
jgi:hypothetical protein